MKKLLLLLFITLNLLIQGCGDSEETVCTATVVQKKSGGLFYLPNQQEPFTGKNVCKYKNGQIASEINYKDGKQDGKVTWWYENGQKQSEGNYKDGECVSGDCP